MATRRTSRRDVELFRTALQGLSVQAQTLIEKAALNAHGASAGEVVDLIRSLAPDVVQTFGDAAASLAADYYSGLRDAAGLPDDFTPAVSDPAPVEQIAASTRWATKKVFLEDAPAVETLGAVKQVVDRLVKQPARDTLFNAGHADPSNPRFARVPTGPVTCLFCAMLASRGDVYLSEASAGDMKDFHDHCDCAVVAIFEGRTLPAGYNPDHYLRIYQANGGASIDLGNESRRSRVDTAA